MSNQRIPGWDKRDYDLYSKIRTLPNYGVISRGDRLVSLNAVLTLLEEAAKAREVQSPKGEV